MSEKLGIDQLEKVLDAVIEGGNVVGKMLATEGSVLSKATHLMLLADEMVGLTGVKIADIKAQFKDLDAAEKAALLSRAKVKFDLANDALEAKIEAGFDLALEGAGLIEQGIAFAGKIAAFVKPAAVTPAVEGQ